MITLQAPAIDGDRKRNFNLGAVKVSVNLFREPAVAAVPAFPCSL
jgi:hypothetical protein